MQNYIITAENIHKSYLTGKKKTLEVLRGVSLSIPPGSISVIIGASGAGKSTLLHILGGLDRPDKGTIFFNGININTLSEQKLSTFRNTSAGFVFQFHHLLPEFTAIENTAIPMMIQGKSQKEAMAKAEEYLAIVGLEARAGHKPAELSGGEQQRVAIARALINNAPVIFADEPTGNLDSANSEAIHELFVSLRNTMNKTFVIVTHNPGMMKLADVIFEMKDGLIINQ